EGAGRSDPVRRFEATGVDSRGGGGVRGRRPVPATRDQLAGNDERAERSEDRRRPAAFGAALPRDEELRTRADDPAASYDHAPDDVRHRDGGVRGRLQPRGANPDGEEERAGGGAGADERHRDSDEGGGAA